MHEFAPFLSIGHVQRALQGFDWSRLSIPGRPGPRAWIIIAVMMPEDEVDMAQA